ncbi:hypothetical protein A9P82_01850 [Arachidicoccus ginsenosidimutans]|uniref:hypothetical protein n=1 Tax=Arachidicoccus sp. BS20 TaxID=1850526 RepID=UPI0007F076F3|nr:hypothetical protein [Arachidicoccus sp. BS20]ANI88164.1 hypothetical protein A9P82_01850 [Arachidicoccus sp. BS20]
MTTTTIRQKLHQYIDTGDGKLLKLLYALAKEYSEDDDFEYTFSEEEIREFDNRRQKRLNGESKLYNWEEAKSIITRKQE